MDLNKKIKKGFNFKMSKVVGASIRKQKQWKSFSPIKKTLMRTKFKDSDRDGVPDKWDCQRFNPFRQDIKPNKLTKERIKKLPVYVYTGPRHGKDIRQTAYQERLMPNITNKEDALKFEKENPDEFSGVLFREEGDAKKPIYSEMIVNPKRRTDIKHITEVPGREQVQFYKAVKKHPNLLSAIEERKTTQIIYTPTSTSFGRKVDSSYPGAPKKPFDASVSDFFHTPESKNKPLIVVKGLTKKQSRRHWDNKREQQGEYLFHELKHAEESEDMNQKQLDRVFARRDKQQKYWGEDPREKRAEMYAVEQSFVGGYEPAIKALKKTRLKEMELRSKKEKGEITEKQYNKLLDKEEKEIFKPFTEERAEKLKQKKRDNSYKFYREMIDDSQKEEGAPIQKQQEWEQKPQQEKITERITAPDTDEDNVPDEYDCQPENPDEQDDYKLLIDYVAGGIKPYTEISVFKDKGFMNEIFSYIKSRGLVYDYGYGPLGKPIIVVRKPERRQLKEGELWDHVYAKGADVILGYPKKAVETFTKEKDKRLFNVHQSFKNISKEDLNYLDFNPIGLTEEETITEINKRKQATTQIPLTPDELTEVWDRYGLIQEGEHSKRLEKDFETEEGRKKHIERVKKISEEDNDGY